MTIQFSFIVKNTDFLMLKHGFCVEYIKKKNTNSKWLHFYFKFGRNIISSLQNKTKNNKFYWNITINHKSRETENIQVVF